MRCLILIDPKVTGAEEIKSTIEADASRLGVDLSLEIKRPVLMRDLPPTVVVAIISATSACLGILINNLLKIGHQKAAQKIVIQGKSGQRLEVPANTSEEQIDRLLEKIRVIDQEELQFRIK